MARSCVAKSISQRRLTAGKDEFSVGSCVFGLIGLPSPISLADHNIALR